MYLVMACMLGLHVDRRPVAVRVWFQSQCTRHCPSAQRTAFLRSGSMTPPTMRATMRYSSTMPGKAWSLISSCSTCHKASAQGGVPPCQSAHGGETW